MEVWVLTLFCVTITNENCLNMAGRWMLGAPPFHFRSQQSCLEHAEGITQMVLEKEHFKMQYHCDRIKPE